MTKILTHVETSALIAKFSKYMLNVQPCVVIGSCEIRFLLIIFSSNTLDRVTIFSVGISTNLFFVNFFYYKWIVSKSQPTSATISNCKMRMCWGFEATQKFNVVNLTSSFIFKTKQFLEPWNSNQMMLCPTEMGVLCWMNWCRGESKVCIAHWSNPFWAPNLGRQLSPPIRTET